MTTQPVSSSSSSSYDVFLSFRGEDTRTNFTDHLYKALSDKGIYTFIDRELTRGEEISPALLKAIEDSRISVIVFSENFASSRWCLDELVEILRCKESKQQTVLPIFYKVDPSDVRNQTNSFGDAFKGLIQSKFKDNEEKVLIWRTALTKAANLSGHPLKDGEYETKFINHIVNGILLQVPRRTCWNVAKYPVGIESRVQDVEMLLKVGGNDRRIVGIWGTSGIGKTTIAKAIWNAIAHKFEGSCFLENVRENSMSHGGLIKLQEALLHKILGRELKIHSVDEGIGVIKEQLMHKKILLILDDVNELKQLDNLAAVGWFAEGSRVITTTQDRGLLKRHGIDLIYKVQKLHGDRALELFSFSAFGTNKPPKDYLELTKRALAYAQGIPLALTLLGSHLCNQDKDRWQDILDSYEGEPYTGIQKILQKSYDALEKSVQQVFLDIACFFNGEKKDYVLQIVSNSKNKVSRDCIEVLIEKAMITIDYYRTIRMHDLLEKLGKDIVHEESPDNPGERSRLWSPEDVRRVLTEKNSGTRKIKGIMLKFSKSDEIRLHSECFVGMVNLEIFINRNVFLSGEVKYLPNELRLIDWGRCQLQSLPSEFHPVHLAEFNMPGGSIRRLEKLKNMPKLTSMNLSGCQFLEKIPDLSGIPNIKYLNLKDCKSLVEVDDSVGLLDKLVVLILEGCVRLTRFATRLRLNSLKRLSLVNCERLESFPEIEAEMESLGYLDIAGSGIRELPSSIAYLTRLEGLTASNCENLTFGYTGIQLKNMPNLTSMDLSDCQFLEKIHDLSGISNIKYFHGCVSLEGCNLSKIDFLLPLHCWSTLVKLDLSKNNFVILPKCISKFVKLQMLQLNDCMSLLEIPEQVLPPRVDWVELDNCTSLEKIPKLSWVLLDNCTWPSGDDEDDHQIFLSLLNCFRLRSNDITQEIFLSQVSVSSPHSQFEICLPGDEVPEWFSCLKDATLVRDYFISPGERCLGRCEVSFEIPPNLKWETLRLVLCVFSDAEADIRVNGRFVNQIRIAAGSDDYLQKMPPENHVSLKCIPLLNWREEGWWLKQCNMCHCQVIFKFYGKVPKMPCGVHLLGYKVSETDGPTQCLADVMAVDDDDQHQDYELLSLSLASKTNLGKRPCGSDFVALDDHRANVVDVGDHEVQWLTLFTGQADPPKRRHIDLNEEPNTDGHQTTLKNNEELTTLKTKEPRQ